jgi:hypothetical protein
LFGRCETLAHLIYLRFGSNSFGFLTHFLALLAKHKKAEKTMQFLTFLPRFRFRFIVQLFEGIILF